MVRLFFAAALLLTIATGCSKPLPKKKNAFDCERLQKRAERCEAAILEAGRRRIEAGRITGDRSAAASRESYLRFKRKFQRKIRTKGVLKECRKVRGIADRGARRVASGLRYCFGRPTCHAFGECLLQR